MIQVQLGRLGKKCRLGTGKAPKEKGIDKPQAVTVELSCGFNVEVTSPTAPPLTPPHDSGVGGAYHAPQELP